MFKVKYNIKPESERFDRDYSDWREGDTIRVVQTYHNCEDYGVSSDEESFEEFYINEDDEFIIREICNDTNSEIADKDKFFVVFLNRIDGEVIHTGFTANDQFIRVRKCLK